MKFFRNSLLAVATLSTCLGALAQEAAIRKNLPPLIPKMPAIDQVSTTPIAGLWEVRVGSRIMYTDPSGNYVIEGQMIDMRTRTNLTQDRISEVTAVNFASPSFKGAVITHRSGNGERKMAVFADPNCGYCKKFEVDLAKLENVTIYTFIIPILGDASEKMSRDIVCSVDPAKAWNDWMRASLAPAAADAKCDSSALARNKEFAISRAVSATPTSFYQSAARRTGAIPIDQINKLLDEPKIAKGSAKK